MNRNDAEAQRLNEWGGAIVGSGCLRVPPRAGTGTHRVGLRQVRMPRVRNDGFAVRKILGLKAAIEILSAREAQILSSASPHPCGGLLS